MSNDPTNGMFGEVSTEKPRTQGKGDKPRPYSYSKYIKGYERIFGKARTKRVLNQLPKESLQRFSEALDVAISQKNP